MVYIECNIRKRIFVTIYFEIINKNRRVCKETNRAGRTPQLKMNLSVPRNQKFINIFCAFHAVFEEFHRFDRIHIGQVSA